MEWCGFTACQFGFTHKQVNRNIPLLMLDDRSTALIVGSSLLLTLPVKRSLIDPMIDIAVILQIAVVALARDDAELDHALEEEILQKLGKHSIREIEGSGARNLARLRARSRKLKAVTDLGLMRNWGVPYLLTLAGSIDLAEATKKRWSRMHRDDIASAGNIGADLMDISVPASDQHLRSKFGNDRPWPLRSIGDCVRFALDLGFEVGIGAADASRGAPELLQSFAPYHHRRLFKAEPLVESQCGYIVAVG